MTPTETVALNCYCTLLIHSIQPRLTYLFPKCKSHLPDRHFGNNDKVIHAVEDYLGATFFHEVIAMLEHCQTKCIYCYRRSLLQAWLLPDLNTIPYNCIGGEFSLAQWLWYWLFNQAALVQILSEPYISAMHLSISSFVTDFVRKMMLRATKLTLYHSILTFNDPEKEDF